MNTIGQTLTEDNVSVGHEKSGAVQITRDELEEFLRTGQISDRLSTMWGIDSNLLAQLISNKEYVII